jgi:hypothetical protein
MYVLPKLLYVRCLVPPEFTFKIPSPVGNQVALRKKNPPTDRINHHAYQPNLAAKSETAKKPSSRPSATSGTPRPLFIIALGIVKTGVDAVKCNLDQFALKTSAVSGGLILPWPATAPVSSWNDRRPAGVANGLSGRRENSGKFRFARNIIGVFILCPTEFSHRLLSITDHTPKKKNTN